MVRFALARGEHHDSTGISVANLSTHIETVHPGQHQVQNHQVRLCGDNRFYTRIARHHPGDLKQVHAEILYDQLGERVIVFDEE